MDKNSTEDQRVTVVRDREKRRKRWQNIHLVVLTLRFVLTVGVLVNMIWMMITLLIGSITTLYLMVSLGVLAASLYGLKKLNGYTDKKIRRCIDTRFGYNTYFALMYSLKKMGIEEPPVYLATHDKNVAAFKNVKYMALCAIESGMIAATGEADADGVDERSHEIAMLLFPGEKELAREQRLIHLIKDRNILDMSAIQELVDVTEGQPLALSEGAL